SVSGFGASHRLPMIELCPVKPAASAKAAHLRMILAI
ncbi:MAG: hypothetical protein ACI87E_005291, partial [Mariniblastus sp.]